MLTPFLPIHIPCSLLTPPSSISLSSAFKREVGEWGVKKSIGEPPYSFLGEAVYSHFKLLAAASLVSRDIRRDMKVQKNNLKPYNDFFYKNETA